MAILAFLGLLNALEIPFSEMGNASPRSFPGARQGRRSTKMAFALRNVPPNAPGTCNSRVEIAWNPGAATVTEI
jgi:hypothetical protein